MSKKILIKDENGASHFIYEGLANAFNSLGYECRFWNVDGMGKSIGSAFNVFDEFEPDIFLGQGYNLDRATMKWLKANPQTKKLLKVGCWGEVNNEINTDTHPILLTSEKEKKNVEEIGDNCTVFNYVHPNRKDYLIAGWEDSVAGTLGMLLAADTFQYYPVEPDPKLECDVAFLGGYWPYKAENLDQYIIPLCYPVGRYNVKVFGNRGWPIPQYMGRLSDSNVVKLFSSATICPNVSEPHANAFGFEVNERIFKLGACKAFVISDEIASLTEDIFTNNELTIAKDAEDFHELVDYYIENPEARDKFIDVLHEKVMAEHTYVHRAHEILKALNIEEEVAVSG